MRYVFRSIIVLTVFIVVGCSPVKMPNVAYYDITSTFKVKNVHRSKSRLTLLVGQPIATPGYRTPKMIYIEVPYKLRSFATNAWVAPPSQMIMPILAQALRNSNYFYAVVTPPFTGITNYRLRTELDMLQQEFLQPRSSVHLVMTAILINNASNRVVASHRFEVRVPAPENNPYSGVIATNAAVSKMAQQVSRFVVAKVKRR